MELIVCELTIGIASFQESVRSIEIILVILGTSDVTKIDVFLSHFLRHQGNAPVVICIFHGFGNGRPFLIGRNITQFTHMLQTEFIAFCRSNHGLHGFFGIKVPVAFHIGINNHGSRMITNHTTGIVAMEFPHRQHSQLLPFLDDGTDIGFVAFRFNQCVERMSCTEGIPEREQGIMVVFTALMNLTIHTLVIAVHITKDNRCYQCMI